MTSTCSCSEPHPERRIVLTGGPGADKTAILELVRQSFCAHVQVLPEAAGILFGGDFPRGPSPVLRRDAQRAIYFTQRELETTSAGKVSLCDRGTVDGSAYWPGPDDFWTGVGTTREAQLLRYDAVVHLRTPTSERGYNQTNPLRDESDVRKAAEAKLGKVEKLVKAPMPGLWEVTVDSQIFYVDDKASYLIFGNLLDMKTGRNITAERQFNALPLELALKQVRGNGKNVMVTFEDPNCGYCKKLAKEMQGMSNVTVYTFLLPILSLDSAEKSRAVWCAADRSKAWNDLMVNNSVPAPGTCDAPIEKVRALAQKYNIRGTPTIILPNGERIPRAIPVAQPCRRQLTSPRCRSILRKNIAQYASSFWMAPSVR